MSDELETSEQEIIELDNEPITGAQKVHSWSRINLFESCPYQYKAIYLDKLIPELNPILIIGRVAHDAICLYARHCIKNGVQSEHAMWKEFALQALEKANLSANYHDEVFKLIKDYADSNEVPIDSVVGAEEKFALNRKFEPVDWLADDVWFRGIFDLFQISGNVAKITDYKTGWAIKHDPFQLKIYAWAVKQLYPHVTDFQVELNFIRHDYQEQNIYNEEDIEDIETKLLNRIKHIEKETKFEPTVGIQCSYCPVWDTCPAMKKNGSINPTMPKTKEEAVELALLLEKHSRIASELKKVMKEFCDKYGAIEAGGRIYKFNVNTGYDFDNIHELFTALDEYGIDLFEYVNVDNRKFKTLMENDRVVEITKKLGTKKVSVTFSTAKIDSKKKE